MKESLLHLLPPSSEPFMCMCIHIQEVMLLGWVGEAITCDQVSLQVSVLWLCMYKCMQTDVQWFHDFNMWVAHCTL